MTDRGLVKWFNNLKGYGFIVHPNGNDVFVHYSAIKNDGYKTLLQGEEVEFEAKTTDKGMQAVHVTRLAANCEMHGT